MFDPREIVSVGISIASDHSVSFVRQRELKGCAWPSIRSSPYTAAMRFDDGPADGQSHSSALRLSREECMEDLLGGRSRMAKTRME